MLKLFEVSGFKNFPHSVAIDFSNTRDYKFNQRCVKNGLIKDAIIYGKNSSGKTNFGLALFDIVAHLTGNNVTPHIYDNYINVAVKYGGATFHYVFQFGSDVVDYRYEKSDNRTLIFEHIELNGELLLHKAYTDTDKTSGTAEDDFSGISRLAPTLNYSFVASESYLKYALNNTALDPEHPLYKMMQFISKMLWFRNLDENRYIGYKTSSQDYAKFMLDSKPLLSEFGALLRNAGVDANLAAEKDSDGARRLYASPSYNKSGRLPFFETASSGTKALYAFFYWIKTSPGISLLFIDEFDAYYHYELSEALVEMLEKLEDTQVILTSHNTNLLTNRIMRPDCYFILSQDKLSSFADATQRELREGHNLEKLYMGGEFAEK
ncbi:MAG: AAA family ATPase [Clostridiales bacterium]|nr:AAA family ATPase [Clostridiales bacterium]